MSSITKSNNFSIFFTNIKNTILNLSEVKTRFRGKFGIIKSNLPPLKYKSTYHFLFSLESEIHSPITINKNISKVVDQPINKTVLSINKNLSILDKPINKNLKKYNQKKSNLTNQKNLFRNNNYKKNIKKKF
jgi:hypothetical protein